MKYPLAYDNWSSKEVDVVTKLLKKRNLTLGKNVQSFEKFCSIPFNEIRCYKFDLQQII